MSTIWLKLLIVVWWLCSVNYHFQYIKFDQEHPRSANWAILCKYQRFLEVTLLQCLSGAVTAAFILKLAKRKPLVFPKSNKKIMAVLVLAHLTGTLALNAAISMHTVHVQNLFQSFEPVMLYILSTCKGYNGRINIYIIFGVLFMSTGLHTFLRHHNVVFTQWGIAAACLSLFMFPLRNVYLKEFGETSNDPVEKYLVISGFSFLLLLPLVVIKLVYTRIVPVINPLMALLSVSFHVVDNLISFFILELFSSLFNSVLRTLILYSIGILSIIYLSLSMTWLMAIGIMLFLVGFLLYYQKYTSSNAYEMRRFVRTCILILHLIFGGNMLWNAKYNTNADIERPIPTVHTFWVYNKPPNQDILLNMERLHKDKTHIFCGTFSCIRKVRDLNNRQFSTSFLTSDDFLRNSPVQKWFKAHSLHKIVSRNNFENHLHEATRLALLWRYGGTFVDPFLRIHEASFRELQNRNSWVTKITNNNSSGIQYACRFKKHHPFVKMLSDIFVKLYYQLCFLEANCEELLSNFNSQSWNAFVDFCSENSRICPDTFEITSQTINGYRKNFGITFEKINTNFLSVGIQNLAISQFFPYVETFKRSNGHLASARNSSASRDMKAEIFTGFDSVSLAESLGQNEGFSSEYIASLRKNAPVGCLDMTTVHYLRTDNIDAYLTGGVSLLMKSPLSYGTLRNDVYIVNLNVNTIKQLPREIQNHGMRLSLMKKKKLRSIYVFLKKIAGAKLVITTDFNCASVSAAFGTPVLLVITQSTPNITQDLLRMFHTWDPKNHTLNSTALLISNLLIGKFPVVADLSLFMRLRATTWNAIRRYESVLESALKFGVVPFTRPHSNIAESTVFHLIFTTTDQSLISLENKKKDGNVKGSFVWRHWRCIESIFYHHPLATVIIHSNTLKPRIFDVLREAGYDIQVKPYSLADLAKGDYLDILQGFLTNCGVFFSSCKW